MATSVFGGGPADVTTDSNGNVVGGVELRVYTAANGGQRVTGLFDLDGNPLPGILVSEPDGDDEGRVMFRAADSYDQLFIDSGNGSRWIIPSRDAFSATSTALANSRSALAAANDATDKADEAYAKVDQFSGQIGGIARLDIAQQSPQYVTTVQPDGLQIVQCVAKDSLTGDLYCSQAISTPGGGEDLRVTRATAAGETISSMRFNGGGHGDTIGVEREANGVRIWFCWAEDTAGTASPNSLVRVQYDDGARIDFTDSRVDLLPKFDGGSDSKITVGLDWENNRMATRVAAGYRTAETYTLRRISDVVGGRNTVLAAINLGDDHDLTQSHTTLGDYLYVFRGKDPDVKRTITRYEWATGSEFVVDVTALGADSAGVFPGGLNEAEGISTFQGRDGRSALLFSKGMGDLQSRISPVWSIAPAGVDTGLSATVESTHRSIQAGYVDVPGGSGEPTFVPVTFKWSFPGVPIIVATANSAVPGTRVTEVSIANPTTTGFDAYLNRTNDSNTAINWIAYYGPGMNDQIL